MVAHVTDERRRRLQDSLLAALLLIYGGRMREAHAALGNPGANMDIPDYARTALTAEAGKTALLVQAGINYQLDAPAGSIYHGVDPEILLQGVRQYNDTTLIPYLRSFAAHQGMLDVYKTTPAGDGSGRMALTTMPDGSDRLWRWVQYTNFPDDCGTADDMSPAPYDDLVSAGNGVPPVHRGCKCDLFPVDWPMS